MDTPRSLQFFRLIGILAALFALGCERASEIECPSGNLLRCRVEAAGDPATERALAPLLAAPGETVDPSDDE